MIDIIITGDLGVNTYIYNYDSNKAVLIDPGSDSQKIIDCINKKEYSPQFILLTHGHFDHIGAVTEIRTKYNIPVYIHTEDGTFIGKNGEQRHREMFNSMGAQGQAYFNHYYKEIKEAEYLFNDGDLLENTGLQVIHTPGHSPGSSCFYSKENKVLFSGDTLFCNGMGRTDFVGGDYNTLLNSLKILYSLPSETVVYPGHGSSTTIGDETP